MLVRFGQKKTISRLIRLFVFWEGGGRGRGSYYSKNKKIELKIIKYKGPFALYDKIR